MLEERIPTTQLLDRRFLARAFAVLGHYLVAGLILYVAVAAVFVVFGLAMSGVGLFSMIPGEAAVPEGPRLRSVRSLPVSESGVGTIQGVPTGKATTYDNDGSFVLVLDPAPAGLPSRTTLDVTFDHTTKVYRDGRLLGNALEAMGAHDGPVEADPTAAGTVVARFRIKDGRVFAHRLDLSDEFPPGIER